MKISFRKVLSSIFVICLVLSLSACKNKNQEDSKKETNDFEIKVAQNIIDLYMKNLMQNDIQGAKKLYTKELADKTKDEGKSDLQVKGYYIEEVSEIGKSGFFKIKVTRMNLLKPVATLDESSIKVIKEDADYKISEVKNETEKEAFLESNTLRIRNKNNIKTNLLIDSSSFPQYTFPKDDKGNLTKLEVPRDKYSVMNFAYEGERIAISTYNKDSYVGIIKIDERTATAANGGGSDSQGDSDQSKDKGGGQSSTTMREKPLGKDMTSLDLIKDSKIEFMSFSGDEQFLMVQYNKANTGRCIRVYNTDSGDIIKAKFEDKFDFGKVDILFSSFDKDVLNFDVVQKDMKDKKASEEAGKYQMTLKDFKIKRI